MKRPSVRARIARAKHSDVEICRASTRLTAQKLLMMAGALFFRRPASTVMYGIRMSQKLKILADIYGICNPQRWNIERCGLGIYLGSDQLRMALDE